MVPIDQTRQQARALLDAAEFNQSLRAARDGLSTAPDDVELLLLAGRAGVEAEAPDAVDYLRRATELAPDDAGAWHYLGEALATEGLTSEADAAFRRAVELDPSDEAALTHLGHTSLVEGREDEGIGYLARAADIAHGASTAAISLVDMYRSFGQFDEALAQAQRLAEASGDDALAWLDVAELSLMVGRLDEARDAFERLRELDDVPGHEAYPLHGMIQVEIRRERWDRARELARLLTTIDLVGLSADLTAFLAEQSGESTERPPSSREEVDAALSASLADYRRALIEDRQLSGGGPLG
jgi:Flp pilus assembly protein TadD